MSETAPIGCSSPFVSVSRIVRGRFVEFAYTHGDPDLAIELIMPPQVFTEFCRERGLDVRVNDESVRAAYACLRREHGFLPDVEDAAEEMACPAAAGNNKRV